MAGNVRLTVRELAEGLERDPRYCKKENVEREIAGTLKNVSENDWPTKHFGSHFRLTLTWIAWCSGPLPTYLPGTDEIIPQNMWEQAFKGYKTTYPPLAWNGKQYEYENSVLSRGP